MNYLTKKLKGENDKQKHESNEQREKKENSR